MTDPRKIALSVLNHLDTRKKTLDALMDEIEAAQPLTDKRDRALLQALVYGVLRWRGKLDRVISHFSKKGIRHIDSDVLNVLRLGIFQIMFMDRIPPSAAVNTSVEMAKTVAAPWTVRFVNAMLRNTARGPIPSFLPPPSLSPSDALAQEKCFPEWLISRWIDRYGIPGASDICDAVNCIPPITIRTNTLRISRESLLESISGHSKHAGVTEHSPEGISFSSPSEPISTMPEFLRGDFQVQDEAAQLVGHILAPAPGETVLDACAGLGGKTGHLAQLMRNSGVLISMDVDAEKLVRLSQDMNRQGITIVETFRCDLTRPLSNPPKAKFDRILLDAPCSGSGVLRRNPDGKWFLSESDLARHQQVQIRFLNHLAPLVKPDGILVYSVCSTEPEENEAVMDLFLESNPDFQCVSVNDVPCIPKDAITPKGFFRSYPHCLFMDGFFAAKLKRVG